jgi:hypothetical protein
LEFLTQNSEESGDSSLGTDVLSNLSIEEYLNKSGTDVTNTRCGVADPWSRAKYLLDTQCPPSETCEICTQGQYFSVENYTCMDCDSNCLTCDGSAKYCTSCPADKILKTTDSTQHLFQELQCVDPATTLTAAYVNPDDSPCPLGTYATVNTPAGTPETADVSTDTACPSCPDFCDICTFDTTAGAPTCLLCKPGFALNTIVVDFTNTSDDSKKVDVCAYVGSSSIPLTTTQTSTGACITGCLACSDAYSCDVCQPHFEKFTLTGGDSACRKRSDYSNY